jgi:type II secretory pathway pseudopilin PulG
MKLTQPRRTHTRRGITLIELTVVILVLLSLVTILFVGAKAWKRGSDRASCILLIRSMQLAARSYQNLNDYKPGSSPPPEDNSQSVALHLLSRGFIEQVQYDRSRGLVKCPAFGTYSCLEPDKFPLVGDLYMGCSLATADKHEPPAHTDW